MNLHQAANYYCCVKADVPLYRAADSMSICFNTLYDARNNPCALRARAHLTGGACLWCWTERHCSYWKLMTRSTYKYALRPSMKREVEEKGRVDLSPEERDRYATMNDLWVVIFFVNSFGSVFASSFGFAFFTVFAGGVIEGFVMYCHRGPGYCAGMTIAHAFLAVQGGMWAVGISRAVG